MHVGYYAISATVTRTTEDGWTSSRQVPTFYLHSRVQGLTCEDDAAKVAADVICPDGIGLDSRSTISVRAVAI